MLTEENSPSQQNLIYQAGAVNVINILVFNIGLCSRAEEKEKLLTDSELVKMMLFDFK